MEYRSKLWHVAAMNIDRTAACAARMDVPQYTVMAWDRHCQRPVRRTPTGHRCDTDADEERYGGVAQTREPRQVDPWSPPLVMATFRLDADLVVEAWPTAKDSGRVGWDRCASCVASHDCGLRVVHQPGLPRPAPPVAGPTSVVHACGGRRSVLRWYRKPIWEAAVDG